MTNNQQYQTTDALRSTSEQLIAYCGIYCKECLSFKSGKCEGCRGNSTPAAAYKKCQVRPCCIENGFFTCADCTIYASTKECKKYNPLLLKIAAWIESSDRSKAIEMIKTKGRADFAAFMDDKQWVIIKTKDTFFNKRLGKKVNEE